MPLSGASQMPGPLPSVPERGFYKNACNKFYASTHSALCRAGKLSEPPLSADLISIQKCVKKKVIMTTIKKHFFLCVCVAWRWLPPYQVTQAALREVTVEIISCYASKLFDEKEERVLRGWSSKEHSRGGGSASAGCSVESPALALLQRSRQPGRVGEQRPVRSVPTISARDTEQVWVEEVRGHLLSEEVTFEQTSG